MFNINWNKIQQEEAQRERLKEFASPIALMMKTLYTELLSKGFTPEQSTDICKQFLHSTIVKGRA